jgi:hypothetical protein
LRIRVECLESCAIATANAREDGVGNLVSSLIKILHFVATLDNPVTHLLA